MSLERADLLALAVLVLLGCCAFVHLMALPIFEDEATQLRWTERALYDGEWLQAFSEGKPLEVWPMTPVLKLGFGLPAVRGLHVLAGMFGAVLTYLLACRLGGRLQAFACGVLFAICPFVVYMQRIALVDTLLCPAAIAVLLATILLAENPTRGRAWALALALLLAAFAKFPVGFVLIGSLPLALVLMPRGERDRLLEKRTASRLVAAHVPVIALLVGVLAVIGIQIYRGKPPGFGIHALVGIALGQYQGISTATGVPRPSLGGELAAQLSWPVLLIWMGGLSAAAFYADWRARWLIVVGALPLFAIGLFADYWFSRYLLFTLPPLIIASVAGWAALACRAGRLRVPMLLSVSAVAIALMGQQSGRLIWDPPSASWSPLDRFQYFEGWGSGYGYPAAARFLATDNATPATVFSLDGRSAIQLRTYLPPQWSTRVRPVMYADDGRLLRTEAQRLQNLLQHAPTWIVISPQLLDGYLDSTFGAAALEQFSLRIIATFDKPGKRSQLAVYEARRR